MKKFLAMILALVMALSLVACGDKKDDNQGEKNIYAQVIDDVAGNTLVSASSLDKEIEGNGGNKTAARAVGKLVAERCKAKGIDTVVFDRGGYLYHGRVAELAEGAREGGLEF